MYRIIPLRVLRRTAGVKFDEMVPSDIPKIHGIDRIISGEEGSISVNFSTRTKGFDLKDNFNIYNLCKTTGKYILLKDGIEDQPDLNYQYPNDEIKDLFKNN